MTRNLNVKAIFPALVIGILCIAARPVQAHPHAWIDLWIEVVFDSSGAITGLRETWLFDDFYSVYATEGMDEDGDGQPDKEPMAELVRQNIESLAEYDYFTKVWSGGTPVKLATVTEMSSEMRDGRLAMIYFVPFEQPVRTDIGEFVYSVYDPSYYTEMLHAEASDAITLQSAPEGCTHQVRTPEPKEEEVALAFSLSPSESVDTDLGQHFAEQVGIRCTSHG